MQTENTNQLTGLELVQYLDSKRTQGEWINAGNYIGVPNIRITNFRGSECLTNEKDEINAQYTALSVNNFAKVVKLLNISAHHLFGFLSEQENLNIQNTSLVNHLKEVKEALNNIKL